MICRTRTTVIAAAFIAAFGLTAHTAQGAVGYTQVYQFQTEYWPQGGLIQASDNALYGVCSTGGAHNVGAVFKINTDGTGHTILYSFNNTGGDGQSPRARIIQGKDGRLYGTTFSGGTDGVGTVFTINTDGTGYAILYSFSSTGGDGQNPFGWGYDYSGALLQGSDNALYGSTGNGGANGFGTLFKINTDGTGYKTMYSFGATATDAKNPVGALIQATDGMLYGSCNVGGANTTGATFKINIDGTGYSVFYSNGFAPNGNNVYAGVIQGSDGVLYGTSWNGGIANAGTVYKLNTDGTGYQVIHFNAATDPTALNGVVQAADGKLYGTGQYGATGQGGIYSLNTDGSGYSVLYSFQGPAGGNDGALAVGALFPANDGSLYGMTYIGGPVSAQGGTIFKYTYVGPLDHFVLNLAPTEKNGLPFGGVNTLTAKDIAGNTIPTFDASANNVSLTANAPLAGVVSGLGTGGNNVLNRTIDFVFGVADLTALGMTYTGTAATGTFTATSANAKVGTSGNVTIVDVPVITWANPASITYPAPLSSVQLNASANVPGTFVYAPPAGTILSAGVQTLTAIFTPTDTVHYAVTSKNVQISILPATLTVTANNATKAFGLPLPTFTYVLSGFVNGDTEAVVNGTPAFSTTANSGSPVGTYPIVPSLGTLSSANYTFVFVSGTLTVTPAVSFATPLVLTPNPALIGQTVLGMANITVGGSAFSSVWDFGDGTTGTGTSVTHIWNNAGIYTVTVTAVATNGSTGTQTAQMFVSVTAGTQTGNSMGGGIVVGGDDGLTAKLGKAKFKINFSNGDKSSLSGFAGSINFPATLKQSDLAGQNGSLTLGTGASAQTFVFTLDKSGRGRATSIPLVSVDVKRKLMAFTVNNRLGLSDLALALGATFQVGLKKGSSKPMSLPGTLVIGNAVYLAFTFKLNYQQIGAAGYAQ